VIIAELFLIAGYGYSAVQQPGSNSRERDVRISLVAVLVWVLTLLLYFGITSLK